MNGNPLPSTGALPLSLERRVDEACDRFEKAWKDGQRPPLEDYLAAVPEPDRMQLFGELLALEIELRCNDGERPTPEEYAPRFPGHDDRIRAAFQHALRVEDVERSPGECGGTGAGASLGLTMPFQAPSRAERVPGAEHLYHAKLHRASGPRPHRLVWPGPRNEVPIRYSVSCK